MITVAVAFAAIPACFALFIWGVIAGGKARDNSAQALDQNAAEDFTDPHGGVPALAVFREES